GGRRGPHVSPRREELPGDKLPGWHAGKQHRAHADPRPPENAPSRRRSGHRLTRQVIPRVRQGRRRLALPTSLDALCTDRARETAHSARGDTTPGAGQNPPKPVQPTPLGRGAITRPAGPERARVLAAARCPPSA